MLVSGRCGGYYTNHGGANVANCTMCRRACDLRSHTYLDTGNSSYEHDWWIGRMDWLLVKDMIKQHSAVTRSGHLSIYVAGFPIPFLNYDLVL